MPVINHRKVMLATDGFYKLRFLGCDYFPKELKDLQRFNMREQSLLWEFLILEGPFAGTKVAGMTPKESDTKNKTGKWIAALNGSEIENDAQLDINQFRERECIGHVTKKVKDDGEHNIVKAVFPLAGFVPTSPTQPQVPVVNVQQVQAQPVYQPPVVTTPVTTPVTVPVQTTPTVPVVQPVVTTTAPAASAPTDAAEKQGPGRPRKKLQM